MKKRPSHGRYYSTELLVLLSGFFIITLLNGYFLLQLGMLCAILLLYCLLGFYHHHLHHDLKLKIVVEYISVSIVILAAFIFINIGTL